MGGSLVGPMPKTSLNLERVLRGRVLGAVKRMTQSNHGSKLRTCMLLDAAFPAFFSVCSAFSLKISLSIFCSLALLRDLSVHALLACVFGVSEYMHMNAAVCRGQETLSDALELELQVVASCPTQVLGTKVGSSRRRASALSH